MTLDEITEQLDRSLCTTKQELVTANPGGNADLDPRLLFFRGDEPIASVRMSGEGIDYFHDAVAVGAGGFDADTVAACFDTFVDVGINTEDEYIEAVLNGTVSATEALQIYTVNRAGDARRLEHQYFVDGTTITWDAPVYPDGKEPTGDLVDKLKHHMDQPSATQILSRADLPAWLKWATDATAVLEPDEQRWIQDAGTATLIMDLVPGHMAVKLFAIEGSPRHQAMQAYPIPQFTEQS